MSQIKSKLKLSEFQKFSVIAAFTENWLDRFFPLLVLKMKSTFENFSHFPGISTFVISVFSVSKLQNLLAKKHTI